MVEGKVSVVGMKGALGGLNTSIANQLRYNQYVYKASEGLLVLNIKSRIFTVIMISTLN